MRRRPRRRREEPAQTPAPELTETPQPSTPPSEAPSPAPGQKTGRLALIVDDCGQWIDTERGFIALQIPLTISVLPDVAYTGVVAREASNAGKGVMLHLPMETVSGMNPGPGKVTTEMSDPQITKQVEDDLAQVPLARGVNNHEGSKASADERVMRDVIGVLAEKGGLFFVDSRTSATSVGADDRAVAGRALGVARRISRQSQRRRLYRSTAPGSRADRAAHGAGHRHRASARDDARSGARDDPETEGFGHRVRAGARYGRKRAVMKPA